MEIPLISFPKERAAKVIQHLAQGMDLKKLSAADKNLVVLYLEAVENIPQTDVDLMKSLPNADTPSDHAIKMLLAYNLWNNFICDGCHAKSAETQLYLCPQCKLAQYCSPACRSKCHEKHIKRCCNPAGPLDDGPHQIVILREKKPLPPK